MKIPLSRIVNVEEPLESSEKQDLSEGSVELGRMQGYGQQGGGYGGRGGAQGGQPQAWGAQNSGQGPRVIPPKVRWTFTRSCRDA